MMPSKERNPLLVLWTAFLFLAVILIGLSMVCAESKAEWVSLAEFRGAQTNRTALSMGLNQARKNHSWLFRNGEMEKLALDRKAAGPSGSPVEWMGESFNSQRFFYYSGVLYHYRINEDRSAKVASGSLDNVNLRSTGNDSTISRTAVGGSWLKLTLADITSVSVDDSTYSIYGFYNDTLVVAKRSLPAVTGALYLSSVNINTSNGMPGSFVANDTMWLVDGTQMHKVSGDSTGSVTYPTYSASITITARGVATTSGVGGADSSYYVVGDIPDSMLGASVEQFYWLPLIDKTPRGIPFIAYRGINNGTTDTLMFYADSGQFGQTADANRIRNSTVMYGFRPSAPQSIYADTGDWDYRGKFRNVHYGVFTPNQPTQYLSSARDYDTRMMRAFWPAQAKVIMEGGTLKLLLWGAGQAAPACGNDQWENADCASKVIYVREAAKKTFTGSVSTAWNTRIAVLHRQRAFYAGNPDSANVIYYSGILDYDNVPAANALVFEGDDPVTGLSSFGQTLIVYRRNSILALTGFAAADFYQTPSPSGVGAVSQNSVARDPYTNCDVFFNELGAWRNCGGDVQEIKISCPQVFTDSINWSLEKSFSCAIYNRNLYLSCVFGGSTKNNRMVVIGLDNGDVTFQYGINPGSLYVHRPGGESESFFVGDADSTRIIKASVGGNDEIRTTSDWRSGWLDLGDRSLIRRVNNFTLAYNATVNDTLFVDFYTDFSETAKYTRTVVAGASGDAQLFSSVGGVVGKAISVGIRTPDPSVRIVDLAIDVVSLGAAGRQ